MSTPTPPQPASGTKHLSILHHPIPFSPFILPLRQISSTSSRESTGTTGSTLWLSAQLLALYLSSLPSPGAGKKVTMLDLGSGVGYLPLCMRAKGYEVIATDIQVVIDTVLQGNVDTGLEAIQPLGGGNTDDRAGIEVIPLDWEEVAVTDTLPEALNGRKIDIITTSDTLYAPHLLPPLLDTLRHLSTSSKAQPVIYIGLERRDPALIDRALLQAKEMGLNLNRVDKGKIDRLMLDAGWESEEWDDVEIWKGKFSRKPKVSVAV